MARYARKKKYYKENTNLPLPIIRSSAELNKVFNATFNGFSVVVEDGDQALELYINGFFGKGNLSRSYPNFFKKDKKPIIRKRQQINREIWAKKLSNTLPKSVIVIPDSDSEDDEYFKNLQPTYELDKSNLKEHLSLTLEEAFFLLDGVKCLRVTHSGRELTSQDAWMLFKSVDKYFTLNYVVYYYYRSKNWVIKSGLKFGGDYLLYKEGPAFYHASYLIIIDVVDQEMKRKEDLSRRSMSLTNILGLQRLCETAAKELLICTLVWPNEGVELSDDIKNVKIKELSVKRWLLPNEDNNE